MSYEDLCCEILKSAALDLKPSDAWKPHASTDAGTNVSDKG
jgi:D-alanine-D-alanine ligase